MSLPVIPMRLPALIALRLATALTIVTSGLLLAAGLRAVPPSMKSTPPPLLVSQQQ